MAHQFDYGKNMLQGSLNSQLEFQNLSHSIQYGVKMHPNLLRKRSSLGEGFLNIWKWRVSKDDIYARAMGPYVNYWENILGLLAKALLCQSPVLLEGFWPSSNWRVNHVQTSIPTSVVDDLEDPIVPPHCGPKNK